MMSYTQIADLARDAAKRAKKKNLKPQRVEDTLSYYVSTGRFNFPSIGSYVPEGWERNDSIEPFLVDKTGLDTHGPALSIEQFVQKVGDLAKAQDHYAIAIIEEGEAQVVVGVFQPDKYDFTHTGDLTEEDLRRAGKPHKR